MRRLFPFLCLLVAACGAPEPEGVVSHVSGRFTLSSEVDDSPDQSGFEVAVTFDSEAGLDTLAFAVTDSTGSFAFDVRAPEAGVYPLVVSRGEAPLTIAELVVADGDTVQVSAQFPLGRRLVRIVSSQNAAWTAYRNAKAQFNQSLAGMAQEGTLTNATMQRSVGQTSTILWSLRANYPGALGTRIAETEAVMMLEGWNDSLLVSRYNELGMSHPNIVDLTRAARRAMARLRGQDAALALVDSALAGAASTAGPGLWSERVIALMDSAQTDQALASARELARLHPDSDWAPWSERVQYELQNLMPGMPAPELSLVDSDGNAVPVPAEGPILLEFYDPSDDGYRRELPVRQALAEARSDLRLISISVEPDTVVNEALLDGRNLSGQFVFLPGGLSSDAARAYNVNVVPTRVLIAADGSLIGKYVGPAMDAVAAEAVSRTPSLTNDAP